MRRRSPTLNLVALEERSVPAVINFTLTTATSTLTLGGSLNGQAITQQGTGSLTTTYSGTVSTDLDLVNTTLQFLNTGSSMKANNSGTWQPAVGGGTAFSPGSAAANYGGNVTVSGLATKVAARGLIGTLDSAPLPLSGGIGQSFSSVQNFTLTVGTVDYNNLLLQGNSSIANNTGPNSASDGTFTDLGDGGFSLVMPCSATITDDVQGLPLILTINGKLNATASLPVVDLNGAGVGVNSAFGNIAGGIGTKIAPDAVITRSPAANLTSMTVALGAFPDGVAESLAADLTGTTLSSAGYDSGTGLLVITGTASLATYQSVLRNVTYANSIANGTAGDRPITVSVTDTLNSSFTRTATGTVSVPAAKVAEVQVNNGTDQRSQVTSLRVTFDRQVALPNPIAAFQLTRNSDGAVVALDAAVDTTGPGTVVNLTFIGGAVNNSSLADGLYSLSVFAGLVNGGNFDGNGDGTAGDDYLLVGNAGTNKLFRFFGDSDGNGTINGTDFADFGNAFGSSGPAFDYDGNNTVDASDFVDFGARFGFTI